MVIIVVSIHVYTLGYCIAGSSLRMSGSNTDINVWPCSGGEVLLSSESKAVNDISAAGAVVPLEPM